MTRTSSEVTSPRKSENGHNCGTNTRRERKRAMNIVVERGYFPVVRSLSKRLRKCRIPNYLDIIRDGEYERAKEALITLYQMTRRVIYYPKPQTGKEEYDLLKTCNQCITFLIGQREEGIISTYALLYGYKEENAKKRIYRKLNLVSSYNRKGKTVNHYTRRSCKR